MSCMEIGSVVRDFKERGEWRVCARYLRCQLRWQGGCGLPTSRGRGFVWCEASGSSYLEKPDFDEYRTRAASRSACMLQAGR